MELNEPLKRVQEQLARDRLAEDVVPYVRSKLQKLLPHGWRVVNLNKARSPCPERIQPRMLVKVITITN